MSRFDSFWVKVLCCGVLLGGLGCEQSPRGEQEEDPDVVWAKQARAKILAEAAAEQELEAELKVVCDMSVEPLSMVCAEKLRSDAVYALLSQKPRTAVENCKRAREAGLKSCDRILGLAYQRQEMRSEACEWYTKALGHDFKNRVRIKRAFNELRCDNMTEDLSEGEGETTSELRVMEATELRKSAIKFLLNGEFEKSLAACEKALEFGVSDCHRIIGIAYSKQGKKKRACQSFRKIKTSNPRLRERLDRFGC